MEGQLTQIPTAVMTAKMTKKLEAFTLKKKKKIICKNYDKPCFYDQVMKKYTEVLWICQNPQNDAQWSMHVDHCALMNTLAM